MLTRRHLLLSAGALGLGAAVAGTRAVATTPAGPGGGMRLGLLQSVPPFIDEQDLAGSRTRALAAFRVLVERSLALRGPMDWLAGGAFPLSGAGPFPPGVRDALALGPGAPELVTLGAVAERHRVRLSLGGWWRWPGRPVAAALLVIEPDGSWRSLPAATSLPPGARIEPACPFATPPGIMPFRGGGTALYSATGSLIAAADTPAETCVVATLDARALAAAIG